MSNVISGFSVILIIIALGFFIGKRNLLGTNAVYPLNMFVFWVALPAMLINYLVEADLKLLFGPGLAVAGLSGLLTGLLVYAAAKLFAKQGTSKALITMLASTYTNSSHLGIPLMAHMLGDATATLPVILFQVGIYAPLATLALDFSQREATATTTKTATSNGKHPTTTLAHILRTTIRNPLILGAGTGVALAIAHQRWGFTLPFALAESLETLSQATVGVALIAFGISMSQAHVLQPGVSPRTTVWTASIIKVVVHPCIAWILAAWVFQLTPQQILTLTVVAALPTGQNVFTYATRYRVGEVLARDTAVVSTLLSAPALCAIFWLLG